MTKVHPTAIVDARAQLGDGVEVGPYAVIRGQVILGKNVLIDAHSVVEGPLEVGDDVQIGPCAFVGLKPQHRQFDAALQTWLIIGDKTIIREGASAHRSTRPGKENATRIGRQCFLMAGSHVAHDCVVGDNVTLANVVMLGGHVHVGDSAFLGGGSMFHQFVRIGRMVVVAGNEGVSHDIPPFAAVRYGGLKGYNAVGCHRAGLTQQSIHAIRQTFRCLESCRQVKDALERVHAEVELTAEVREILDFIASSKRGIIPIAKKRAPQMPIE